MVEVELDIMLDRCFFLKVMEKKQVAHLHWFEKKIGRRQVGGEIGRSRYEGKRLQGFLTGIKMAGVGESEFNRFKDDVWGLRPLPNDDWDELDCIHAWDWDLWHKINLDKYTFRKSTIKKGSLFE